MLEFEYGPIFFIGDNFERPPFAFQEFLDSLWAKLITNEALRVGDSVCRAFPASLKSSCANKRSVLLECHNRWSRVRAFIVLENIHHVCVLVEEAGARESRAQVDADD